MGMSSGGGRGGPLSEINVTPLVDVMLVLLIIFMVAAPMLTTGVTVDLPNADAPDLTADEDTPLISIAKNGEIYLFDQEVPFDKLRSVLKKDPKVQEANEIYVHADESVPYGEVVKVLAIIRDIGIGKMGLVTDPPKE